MRSSTHKRKQKNVNLVRAVEGRAALTTNRFTSLQIDDKAQKLAVK